MTYPITFACYGVHLHGSGAGSVDRERNVHGTPLLEVDSELAAAERERMDQTSYNLDQIRRDGVLEAIQEVCGQRGCIVIHDIGTHEGAPYLVSELLEGETLRSRLNGGALPFAEVVEYALGIADGLAARQHRVRVIEERPETWP